jgi:hypothetical protein
MVKPLMLLLTFICIIVLRIAAVTALSINS